MTDPASTSHGALVPPFDIALLQSWVEQHVKGLEGPMRVERTQSGQSNPTYFLCFDNRDLVLRKQPPGELLPSAHAVDREFRVQRALQDSDVPVPEMLCYCDDRSVVGTPFYLMQRVEGRVMRSQSLPDVPMGERRAYFRAMAQTLARLHTVDWTARGLADYGRPEQFFERQIARWTRQWQASKGAENPNIDRLIDWLPRHVPARPGVSITHGDFRMGNLIFHPQEPRVVAVLDWELSTLGHPLADVAFSGMFYHTVPSVFDGLHGLDLAALGLPTQAEYFADYRAASGRTDEVEPFHLAFSLFRFAVILEGVAARARAGNSASGDAAQVGAQAAAFAAAAVALV